MSFSVQHDNFFVNAPFKELQDHLLEIFIAHDLQPEIGLEGGTLYDTSENEFKEVAKALAQHGLRSTLHAPFFDLSPGALDPYILQATRHKLRLAFDLIPIFRPKVIVCHLNFEDNKHGYKHAEWFKHAQESWADLLEVATRHQTTLVLENTYEQNPEQHLLMLNALDSPFCKFCLDTGHLNTFAQTSWQPWKSVISRDLGHIHLHDNLGDRDSHLAVGRGNFDFSGLFAYLAKLQIKPTVTIEPHTIEDLWACLKNLQEMAVLEHNQQ